VKANIYLALAAVFAAAMLIARTFVPHQPFMVVWNGLLAIFFRYAAARAKMNWQIRREPD
jgi:hypothetical protein